MGRLEEWRTHAELTSREEDVYKLMELAEQLRHALERELLTRATTHPSLRETAPQETDWQQLTDEGTGSSRAP